MSEDLEFVKKLKEADARQGDLKEALGAMIILFGNTEQVIGMGVVCLLRIATREASIADRLGPIIISQLDLQRKMNLVKMLSQELLPGEFAELITDWKKDMESVVNRRNQLIHNAWMFPVKTGTVGTLQLGRSGTYSIDKEVTPSKIKPLCSEVGRLNNQFIQCFADHGILPRVQD